MSKQRVAIVGAGIVGLAHAWSAAERRCHVTVFERSARACGASIRNFGMIWPIGQPCGENHQLALSSRQRWLKLADDAGIWVNPCGSIHLAHRHDEWEVLQQFAALAPEIGVTCELLSPQQVLEKTPAANPAGLLGGLFSPSELGVNPREALRMIPGWLQERHGVEFRFQTPVSAVEPGRSSSAEVRLSSGERMEFDRVIVCSGADFLTLFPDVFATAELKRCKLQMFNVRQLPANWKLGPHIASGLTLRHYKNFEICPGLKSLQFRIDAETPELNRYGIHVMASQTNQGDLILGDSHEYGDDIEPFDSEEIHRLMLRELQNILRLPHWSVGERWHGVYAKHSSQPYFQHSPFPGVHLFSGTGGSGMTMSFGLAERFWDSINTSYSA